MPDITFRFISSGDTADYAIIAHGQPEIHNARIAIRYRAQPLYWTDGTSRFNYTEDDYKKYVQDTVGYLYWHRDGPVPWPVVRAFDAYRRENHEAAQRKYPDLEMELLELVKGRFHLDPNDFTTVILEDIPQEERKE